MLMIRQYTIEPAYTGSSRIDLYEDGKRVKQFIICDWEIPSYAKWAEQLGYERAFDEDLYLEKYRIAEEAYRGAIADLEYAREHRLIKRHENGAD